MSILSTFRHRLARAIAPEVIRSFDAAGAGRRFREVPNFQSYRVETALANQQIRARARHLAANNAYAANGVENLVTGLIGSGITPASTNPDLATRKAQQAKFKQWAYSCDAEGRTDYYGIQAATARSLVVDGEAFLQIIETDDGQKLKAIPPELIQNASASVTIDPLNVSGIQFGPNGDRISYSVRKEPWSTEFVQVQAADMIHLMSSIGTGQVRGVSWLAPVLLKLADVDATEDALLMGFKIAALHAGFVTNLGQDGELPFTGNQKGDQLDVSLEPGTVKVLPIGADIKFNAPMQASQGSEFLAAQLRAVAAGLHMPDFLLSGDMRNANYSSMRSALVAYRQFLERVQYQTIIPQLCDVVWSRLFLGEDAPVEHYPPSQPWVDPLKDVEATAAEIAAGLTSRRQAVARRGYDIEDLDQEIAADRQREKELGLAFQAVQPIQSNQNGGPQNAQP